MTWTKEKPTVPGWYWCDCDFPFFGREPVFVQRWLGTGPLSVSSDDGVFEVEKIDGARWAGPIPEPTA